MKSQTQLGTPTNSRHLSTFSATLIIIGNIIGVGVFFKNISVFSVNGNNAYGILISWLVGALIAISTAVCIGKIAGIKTKKENSGMAGWVTNILGPKAGNLLFALLPFCYFGFCAILFSVLISEAFFSIISTATDWTPHFGYIALFSVVISVYFCVVNCFKPKFSNLFSKYGTMFKFIPIMTIITTGIIFAGIHGIDGSFFNGGTNGTNGISKLSITAIFTCLPSVMFSFDGFSSAGSISSRIKNPEKGVPLAMLSAMIVASVVYISVSLAEIFSGASSVFALAGYIGNDDAEKAFNIVIATFIFACTLFSCNGLTMAAVSTMQATAEENKIIGSKAVTKKFTKDLHAGGFYFLCTLLVVFLIFTLPCIILNGDQILDISSNAIVVVFFFIYGTMIFVALIKFHLFTILQSCLAVFSSLMCVGLAGYFLVYSSIVKLIHDANEPAGAGMLDGGSEQFKYYVVAIIFWASVIVFVGFALLNMFLMKSKDNKKQLATKK